MLAPTPMKYHTLQNMFGKDFLKSQLEPVPNFINRNPQNQSFWFATLQNGDNIFLMLRTS